MGSHTAPIFIEQRRPDDDERVIKLAPLKTRAPLKPGLVTVMWRRWSEEKRKRAIDSPCFVSLDKWQIQGQRICLVFMSGPGAGVDGLDSSSSPHHLRWCLWPAAWWNEPSPGPQNHLVSTYTSPPLHKSSWSSKLALICDLGDMTQP